MSADIRMRFELVDPSGATGAAAGAGASAGGPLGPPSGGGAPPWASTQGFDPGWAAILKNEMELRSLAVRQAYEQEFGRNLPIDDPAQMARRRRESEQRASEVQASYRDQFGMTDRERQAHERRQERDENWLASRDAREQRRAEQEARAEARDLEARMARAVAAHAERTARERAEEREVEERRSRERQQMLDEAMARRREEERNNRQTVTGAGGLLGSLGMPGATAAANAMTAGMQGNMLGMATGIIEAIKGVLEEFGNAIRRVTQHIQTVVGAMEALASNRNLEQLAKEAEMRAKNTGLGPSAWFVGDDVDPATGIPRSGSGRAAVAADPFMAMSRLPFVRSLVDDGIKAGLEGAMAPFKAADAFVKQGRELGGLSGPLASASALADVRKLIADIQEADVAGSEMSRLIEAQSKFSAELRADMLERKRQEAEALAKDLEERAENLRIKRLTAEALRELSGSKDKEATVFDQMLAALKVMAKIAEEKKEADGADKIDKMLEGLLTELKPSEVRKREEPVPMVPRWLLPGGGP